jgi:hypothetical protein
MSRKKKKRTKSGKTVNQKSPKANSKIPLLSIAIVAVAIIGIGFFAFKANRSAYVNATDVAYKNTSGTNTNQNISSPSTSATSFEKLRGGETKPVLSPTRFKGKTASAYNVAQEYPELLDAMYCYCYCKKTIGHKSLLSCFTDRHAANCTICQDQAFYAKIMQKKGLDIGQVRKEVDRKFWRPFS